MAKRGRPPKKKLTNPAHQEEMRGEGMERPSIPEIEKISEEYEGYRDERLAWGKKEIESKKKLLETMHEKGLTLYKYQGSDGKNRSIEVLPSEKVKVVKEKDETEPSQEE